MSHCRMCCNKICSFTGTDRGGQTYTPLFSVALLAVPTSLNHVLSPSYLAVKPINGHESSAQKSVHSPGSACGQSALAGEVR